MELPASEIRGIAFEVTGNRMRGSLIDLGHGTSVEPVVQTEVVRG